MSTRQRPTLPLILSTASRQFGQWRSQQCKHARLPQELWRQAAALAREHGLNKTARALGLKYYSLKNHLAGMTTGSRCSSAAGDTLGGTAAQSVIPNAQVRITIDYEMVDLGEGGAPLSFGSLVGADALVYGERYILLQTYTITNITQRPIENLEFYQMLHGHPAEIYEKKYKKSS